MSSTKEIKGEGEIEKNQDVHLLVLQHSRIGRGYGLGCKEATTSNLDMPPHVVEHIDADVSWSGNDE